MYVVQIIKNDKKTTNNLNGQDIVSVNPLLSIKHILFVIMRNR